MPTRNRPLLAVLIDADNVPSKHAKAILKEIADYGEPALRRVYGDWSSAGLQGWTEAVRTQGLAAQQESANTEGKNASDIGMVIDAMDIMHTGRFDGFVLVSSDSDFTALANRIREQGLEVIGIGEKKTPESLQNVCNRFVLIENIVDSDAAQAGAKTKSKKLSAKHAERLIVSAMEEAKSDDDWYLLTRLANHIYATKPDFAPRNYGHAKLSELVKSLDHRFQTRGTGKSLSVRKKK